MKTVIKMVLLLTISLMSVSAVYGGVKRKLHPMNAQLIKAGLMPYPKYYPEVPRITAQTAYNLYKAGKALVLLISYTDKDKIYGGFHLTEGQYPKINPNKLPFKKGQYLVVY